MTGDSEAEQPQSVNPVGLQACDLAAALNPSWRCTCTPPCPHAMLLPRLLACAMAKHALLACKRSDSDTAGRRACSLAHHTALQVIWRRALDESCGLTVAFPGQLSARIPLKHSHTRLLPASARHTLAPTHTDWSPAPPAWNWNEAPPPRDHGRCSLASARPRRRLGPSPRAVGTPADAHAAPGIPAPQHPSTSTPATRPPAPALATQLWSRPPHFPHRPPQGPRRRLFALQQGVLVARLAAAQAGGCWLHIASRPSSLPPSLPHPWCRRAGEPPTAAPFECARAPSSPSTLQQPAQQRPSLPSPARTGALPPRKSLGDCSAWPTASASSSQRAPPACRQA